MKKRTPHCKLFTVKALIEAGKVRTTQVAREGANELGLKLSDMLAVVMALTPADLHDHSRRPHNLARRVPTKHAGGLSVSETDGH